MGEDKTVSLQDCEYRVQTHTEELFFCRHSRVRAPNGVVNHDICGCCELADTSCDEPRLLPSELSGAPAGTRVRLAIWDGQLRARFGPEDTNSNVSFGITAFRRPDSLVRLVKSIREFYPDVSIVIADNGDQYCEIDDENLTYLKLPFDCGLSAARNALVAEISTDFMLLLEDDFEFTAETQIERFVDILRHFPNVGVVGGSLYMNGELLDFASEFRAYRNELTAVRVSGRYLSTPEGNRFQYADMVFNFCLFRRQMLAEHPWDETLKLCEHVDYFLGVRDAQRWRVAFCDLVRCVHHRDRHDGYDEFRLGERASGFTRMFRRKHGLEATHVPAARYLHNRLSSEQNIILFGVGHSGTSVVTQILLALGWLGEAESGDLDSEFLEHVAIRRLNDFALANGRLPLQQAYDELQRLPSPWVIKDPRFVHTMHLWMPVFCDFAPSLFWLVRDLGAVQESYRRRQFSEDDDPESRGHQISQLFEMAETTFLNWPWSKKRIDYEAIRKAVLMFDGNLAKSSSRDAGFSTPHEIDGG